MLSRVNKLCEKLYDNEAVFISSYPNIFYYSGFTSEDAYLIISHNERILITDSRYTIQAHNQAPDFEIVDLTEGFKKIFERVSASYIGFEEDVVSVSLSQKLQTAFDGKKTLVPMQKKISSLRQIKDKDEIRHIREAERLGDEAFTYVLDKIKVGATEREIAL